MKEKIQKKSHQTESEKEYKERTEKDHKGGKGTDCNI